MPPAARVTDPHTCPMSTGPVPHVGGPIVPPAAPTVLINDLPAATVTSMATCVGPPDTIVKGSAGVFINYLPAARMGDLTAHGGVIISGSPNVMIGEVGEGSPGAQGAGGMVMGMATAQIVPASFESFVRRYPENRILCTLICFCNLNPDISSRGYRLKQRCVSSSLKAIDHALGGKSPFKPEVSYNTATNPPTLLPNTSPETPEGYDRWRPDVVITENPLKPPTADNISRVVEIKFPPDYMPPDQRAAYEKIAGGPDKLDQLGPKECGCDTEGLSQLARAAVIAAMIAATLELLAELAAAAAAASAAVAI